MTIFKTYTGNAMLNNALMTIEALGKLNNVADITTDNLLKLYEEKGLLSLNKRLRSYYMLFLNNPLINKPVIGEEIYNSVLLSIIKNCDFSGKNTCEITGFHFEKTFESFYEDEIEKQREKLINSSIDKKQLKKELDKLDKTDLTINRGWFPLIGGLGSDAQALPQAKFAVQIHPICIPIMQFLPLSALLYKGGVLLVDSSNFEFARSFVENNVKEVEKRIQATSSTDSIENIKDYAKGSYLLKAMSILEEKEIEEEYSDLNLWSFSNSGTGASCEIERVPNSLIKKLIRMRQNTKISNELKGILTQDAHRFLEDLEDNQDWYLLYPAFGTGKNKGDYEGVSVEFMEAYYKEIQSSQKTDYAKYIAHLIEKYKADSFAKYLGKRDAWKEKDFKADLYAVLVKATENGEWDLLHHIEILDNVEEIPVKNNFYNVLKITHFYYYKKTFGFQLPKLKQEKTVIQNICEWLIAYIQNDDRQESLKKDLLSVQNYYSANYTNVFYRASQQYTLDLESIFYALYDEDYRISRIGLNSLLRIFFSQPEQDAFEISVLEKPQNWILDDKSKYWFMQIQELVQDYQAYYFDKYENKETGFKPFSKFLNLVTAIPNENSKFLIWFYEAIENTNEFLKGENKSIPDKWSEALLYEPNGEYALSFAKFAIKFSLLKQHQKALNTIHNHLNNN